MKEYFYKPEYKYMYLANVSYSFIGLPVSEID